MFKSVFNCLEDWVRAGVVKMVGLPKDARANKLKDFYKLSELCFSVCVCELLSGGSCAKGVDAAIGIHSTESRHITTCVACGALSCLQRPRYEPLFRNASLTH